MGLSDQQRLFLVEGEILHAFLVRAVMESTMISGCSLGQPVANAVTKSADVDRFVVIGMSYAADTKAVTSISTLARASTRPAM